MIGHRTSIFLVSILLSAITSVVQADSGFTPFVDHQEFSVSFAGDPLPDAKFLAAMICQDEPLPHMKNRKGFPAAQVPRLKQALPPGDAAGKWRYASYRVGGHGVDSHVDFTAFADGVPDRFRVVIYLPSLDKHFLTHEVQSHALLNQYHISLSEDGTAKLTLDQSDLWLADWAIAVTERGLKALALTLILELLVVVFLCRVFKKHHLLTRMTVTCLCINVLTLPPLWFFSVIGFVMFGLWSGMVQLIVLEVIVVIVEGFAYTFVGRAGWKLAPLLALLANSLSFLVGLFVI